MTDDSLQESVKLQVSVLSEQSDKQYTFAIVLLIGAGLCYFFEWGSWRVLGVMAGAFWIAALSFEARAESWRAAQFICTQCRSKSNS